MASLVLAAAVGIAQPPATPAASRLKEAIVVYATHFDIGFTALSRDVVERYRTTTIDKARTPLRREMNFKTLF